MKRIGQLLAAALFVAAPVHAQGLTFTAGPDTINPSYHWIGFTQDGCSLVLMGQQAEWLQVKDGQVISYGFDSIERSLSMSCGPDGLAEGEVVYTVSYPVPVGRSETVLTANASRGLLQGKATTLHLLNGQARDEGGDIGNPFTLQFTDGCGLVVFRNGTVEGSNYRCRIPEGKAFRDSLARPVSQVSASSAGTGASSGALDPALESLFRDLKRELVSLGLRELKAMFTQFGHTLSGEGLSGPASVHGKNPNGLIFHLVGWDCAGAASDCGGLEMRVEYTWRGAAPYQKINNANLQWPALAVWYDPKDTPGEGTLGISRYIMLGDGVTSGNLKKNLDYLLAEAAAVESFVVK